MNKKAIAVFCVLVLMVSVFSACGKELQTAEIAGENLPAVTDENGELVTDSEGMYAVYVTDAKGETVTAEDGSPDINYTPNRGNGPVIYNNTVTVTLDIESARFTLKNIDGWQIGESDGRLYKDGTERKCCISVNTAHKADGETTFKSFIDQRNVQNNTLAAKINAGEHKDSNFAKVDKSNESITYLGCEAQILRYTIYGNKGEIVNYAEDIYFAGEDGNIYNIAYVCTDGVGYDKNFNFIDWANKNVKMTYPIVKE